MALNKFYDKINTNDHASFLEEIYKQIEEEEGPEETKRFLEYVNKNVKNLCKEANLPEELKPLAEFVLASLMGFNKGWVVSKKKEKELLSTANIALKEKDNIIKILKESVIQFKKGYSDCKEQLKDANEKLKKANLQTNEIPQLEQPKFKYVPTEISCKTGNAARKRTDLITNPEHTPEAINEFLEKLGINEITTVPNEVLQKANKETGSKMRLAKGETMKVMKLN